MDILSAIALILGLVIRLAIPVAITVLLVWGLKKLDRKWQEEAEREMNAARPVTQRLIQVRNPGCWEIQGCSDEKKATCKAYAHPETPCWQIFRTQEGQLQAKCLECQVFQTAPVPI